jgi:hypothetical protein
MASLPNGTYQNVNVVTMPDVIITGDSGVVSSTISAVTTATSLAQFSVTGACEFTLPASTEGKKIKINGIHLASQLDPDVYTEYVALVSVGAAATQTANTAPVVTVPCAIGKNYFASVPANDGTNDVQLYTWRGDDLDCVFLMDSSLKVNVVLAHVTSDVTYSALSAASDISLTYELV